MRTTITFDPDIEAEINRLRRQRGQGVSAVVNDLVRRALTALESAPTFVQETSPMGARVDLSTVAEVLETVEGPESR